MRTILFHGGTVRTMVDDRATAEALVVSGDEILAVGDLEQLEAAAGPDPERVDLAGGVLLPGFIDAHHHFSQLPLMSLAVDVSPEKAPNIEALIARLAAASEGLPDGAWVFGLGYDELALADRRVPTRDDLDAASRERPVTMLHYSGHEGVANSRALELGGIDRHTPDPPAGIIVRGPDGEPTGYLIETAYSHIGQLASESLVMRNFDDYLRELGACEQRLFAAGITRVCDPTVPEFGREIYARARDAGLIRLPVVMMPCSSQGHLIPPWDCLDGPPTGEGTEPARVGPLKIFLDGATRCALCLSLPQAFGSLTTMLAEALRGELRRDVLRSVLERRLKLGRDLKLRDGVLYHTREGASELVRSACERGFCVAIHAIGNAAVDRALDAIEAARSLHTGALPPRIEHGNFMSDAAIRRAADLGVSVVSQPLFVQLHVYDEMPLPSGLRIMGHRSLIDAGVRVAGSSDSPVAGFEPLAALRAAVIRRTRRGRPLQLEQSITPAEALGMYTREAAAAVGASAVAGTLEPGKRADLVLLSRDPCELGVADLESVEVRRTYLAGDRVFG